MTLYTDINFLRSQIEALLIEFPELAEDAEFAADVFEGQTDLNYVIAKLVETSLEADAMAEAIKLRASALSDRKMRFERKEEAARKLILSLLEQAGLPKLQLTEATLSVRHIAPAPIVADADALPDNCVRIERKPDMKAIKAEIEGGREVPGVVMSNGRASLTIRTK